MERFTKKQISVRNNAKDAVVIIDNVVYDLTGFLDEHPGGHEVLLAAAGRDASEDFDDVGHSLDAKELMHKFVIGELVEEEKVQHQKQEVKWEQQASAQQDDASAGLSWKVPLLVGIALTLLYTYFLG